MKIISSNIQLSGRQQESIKSTQLERLSVATLGQMTTERTTEENSANNQKDSASIQLSMTTTTQEQQSIQTQSLLTYVDDDRIIKQHAGLEIANYVVQETSEMTLSVAEVSQALVGGDAAVLSASEINADSMNELSVNSMNVNDVQLEASRNVDVEVEVLSVLTQESEQNLTFEALGQVTTEDGHHIDFMLALDYQRSTQSEQINQFIGNRNLIDPLMINLSGAAVEFSDLTFEFDLNADGKMDSITQTASGSGYIVFDKNGNGEIDDGREMFGPQSGQGFAELSAYDDDGNGWIDENDAIYQQLGVMSFGEQGRETQSLMSAQVGAIFLGSVASDYQLNTQSGGFVGNIKQSGVGLSEDGRALLIQEVHLLDYGLGMQSHQGQGVADVITEWDSGVEGELKIESALNLFQFTDPIIVARNAETQVRISSSEAFTIEANENRIKGPYLAQQTFDRAAVADELSSWVANAMVDFEPRPVIKDSLANKEIFYTVDQAKTPVFGQALEGLDLDALKLESKLSAMRSMVDSLREMRMSMTQSEQKLSLYHDVYRFK